MAELPQAGFANPLRIPRLPHQPRPAVRRKTRGTTRVKVKLGKFARLLFTSTGKMAPPAKRPGSGPRKTALGVVPFRCHLKPPESEPGRRRRNHVEPAV